MELSNTGWIMVLQLVYLGLSLVMGLLVAVVYFVMATKPSIEWVPEKGIEYREADMRKRIMVLVTSMVIIVSMPFIFWIVIIVSSATVIIRSLKHE